MVKRENFSVLSNQLKDIEIIYSIMATHTSDIALFHSYDDPVIFHNARKQYGDNGNPEYAWSSYFKEKIVQLSFQLTRTYHLDQLTTLGNQYNDLLQEAFLATHLDNYTREKYISVLYRMMLYTRDIIDGKGEYQLFYMLLAEWVKLSVQLRISNSNSNGGAAGNGNDDSSNDSNEKKADCIDMMANNAVDSLVYLKDDQHPYGSWKDIKYLLTYLRTRRDIGQPVYVLPIFKHTITLAVEQLRKDELSEAPSLLGRWLPREKSKKFGWLAKHIACEYFSSWLLDGGVSVTAKDKKNIVLSNRSGERKCLTYYRKLLAGLNRKLQTVQVNQCGQSWKDIDFEKSATSITLTRQKNAFQYKSRDGYLRGEDIDRLICKDNYELYIQKCMLGKVDIKGKRTSIVDLVKDALEIVDSDLNREGFAGVHGLDDDVGVALDHEDQITRDTINLQWVEGGKNLPALKNCISLVDTSGSMEGQPMLAAIGLGCRIAEKSLLGKRVITFSAQPSWIDLSNTSTLIEMTRALSTNKNWGMNTNFVSAMKLVLDACIEKELTPDEVSALSLVVFSDMQIDQADSTSDTMHEIIKKMFYNGGLQTKYKTPYSSPHIIYWNLRSTTGTPVLSSTSNVSMISGFSPVIIKSICEKGREALADCTPWAMFNAPLDSDRYAWVNDSLHDNVIFEKPRMAEAAASSAAAGAASSAASAAASAASAATESTSIVDEQAEAVHLTNDNNKPSVDNRWGGWW